MPKSHDLNITYNISAEYIAMLACRSSAAFQGRVHETSRDRPRRRAGSCRPGPGGGPEGAGNENAHRTGPPIAGQDPKRRTREFCYRGDRLPTCLQTTLCLCPDVWLVAHNEEIRGALQDGLRIVILVCGTSETRPNTYPNISGQLAFCGACF